MANSLMLMGTSSNVGKSVLCAALCRILHQEGVRVAPFKSQNMSLNSAVTPSGREIGRAQAVQAEACGIVPNEHMNPVLLKPMGGMRSQIIIQGQVYDTRSAKEYFLDQKEAIFAAVTESYRFLEQRYEVIVIEGAGSPVEMNLKPREIANMRTAELADAPVILVADIDRGGVFAAVVGTLQLLEPHERARVKGLLINKFRGDPALFAEGRKMLETYADVPVLGVIPYLRDIGIDEEDSVGLQSERYRVPRQTDAGGVQIAIVQVPHLSNFTDFDPLFLEPYVHAYFCSEPSLALAADAIILPGSKSTILDLQWLRTTGWAETLATAQAAGVWLFGICGGFQMLGERVLDPLRLESNLDECAGLCVFAAVTTLQQEKATVWVAGELQGDFAGMAVEGYEIHSGTTRFVSERLPFALTRQAVGAKQQREGGISSDGRVIGTYLHGIFHNDGFRTAWLNRIRSSKGLIEQGIEVRMAEVRTTAFDQLADAVRANTDMDSIYALLHISGTR